MLHSSQRQRGGGAGASSAASRARFFAPRFGFGSPGFLPEKCTVSPACTLNMRAVITGAVTAAASALPAAAASALPAAAASELPAAASLRAALASLRAALAALRAALAALSSLLPVSEPASSCSSAKIRASSSLPIGRLREELSAVLAKFARLGLFLPRRLCPFTALLTPRPFFAYFKKNHTPLSLCARNLWGRGVILSEARGGRRGAKQLAGRGGAQAACARCPCSRRGARRAPHRKRGGAAPRSRRRSRPRGPRSSGAAASA